MRVLGIESSCDETAASVVDGGRVLSDVISSQVAAHRPYGGVVPEIASRKHLVSVVPVISEALDLAGAKMTDLDGVAVTAGPGLLGSLLVGTQVAKGIACSLDLPLVAVNHLRGHLLAARIPSDDAPRPEFPFMALLASGGHTGVYLVEAEDHIECLGQTRDDAAGEAFDKVAKLLGLGYPGGPVIDRLAADDGPAVTFPQALRQRDSYEFSFSGIKTAVAQHVKKLGREPDDAEVQAIARGFQRAVIEILVRKVTLAARARQVERIVLAGGVAANNGLRTHAAEVCAGLELELFAPPPERCTDNASMIAFVGEIALAAKEHAPLDLSPRANWPL
ncbi:MAG: tRNA (adenosine(37)-N6)-threonylcarbamoyltransferase complex transferase subunit TsaD [Deltaproteobacteria bacterium]|nr:tRNA (adenosine(37)-N6)-threonylcarbamoyltransferase complex transferase subunit TsaD [Deltaproteobacteria bacterium]